MPICFGQTFYKIRQEFRLEYYAHALPTLITSCAIKHSAREMEAGQNCIKGACQTKRQTLAWATGVRFNAHYN